MAERIQDLSFADGGHFALLPERRGNSVAARDPLSIGASAPPDTRDLGRAAPLDNTRPRALYRTGAGGAAALRGPGDRSHCERGASVDPRKGSRSMFWQSQGGGPWGTGPRGGGPWGGGDRGNGGAPGPRGRGPQPPDFEELLRRGQDRFRRVLPPGGFGNRRWIAIGALVIVGGWVASGIYTVDPDQVGVVLRFGAYNRTTEPGLNYHLPSPIEKVLTPSVTRVNRTEIGYRGAEGSAIRGAVTRQVPEEALMLTGDENIVDINFTVFWIIKDAKAYLFNIRNIPEPDRTVKAAAESAMREVIGETPDRPGAGGRAWQNRDRHAQPAPGDPQRIRGGDRGHPAAVAEGRSSGSGHRRLPRRPARARRPRAAAQRGRGVP